MRTFFAENPVATVAMAREYAIEVMMDVGELYGNACSQAALDLQYEIAAEFGSKPPKLDAGWYYKPDAELVSDAARYQACKLDVGDVDGFIDGVADSAKNYAKRGANATMSETARSQERSNKKKKRRKGEETPGMRFARVPQSACPCDMCLMNAARGFVYLSAASAGKFHEFHIGCECRIIPGYEDTELEGYDPKMYGRMLERVRSAETLDEHFYSGRASSIIKDSEEFDKAFKSKWREYKKLGKRNAEAYQLNVGAYLDSLVPGMMSAEDFTHLEGKEILLGKWFAESGKTVRFMKAENETRRFDCLIDGVPWEFKQPTSPDPMKVHDRIKDGLGQCENIVIDLSRSSVSLDQALSQAARALENDGVEQVLIVKAGKLVLMKK